MPSSTVAFSIDQLLSSVAAGELAVPDFQRDFVWDPSRVAELVDSVSRDWPIGAILLLSGPQPFDVRPLDDGPLVASDRVRYFLLDGQQRVTALWHAVADHGDTVYYVDFDKADGSELPPIQWGKRTATKGLDQGHRYRVSTLVSSREFARAIAGSDPTEKSNLEQLRRQRLGPLIGNQYQLTATVMDSDIGLDALTRIFETLNRTGVKLDAFDLVVAALRREDFLMRERWEEALGEYEDFGKYDVAGQEILKVLAVWQRASDDVNARRPPRRRVTGIRQRDMMNLDGRFVVDRWPDALAAYAEALSFARDNFGIERSEDVPSWAMLVTLSIMLEAREDPRNIRAWYWRSIALQSYAQGANTRVISDLSDERPDLSGWSHSLRTSLRDSVPRNKILRLGVRGLLRHRNARDPIDATPLSHRRLVELSIPSLTRGEIPIGKTDSLLDLLTTAESHVNLLRRDFRTGLSWPTVLAPLSLPDQGIHLLEDGVDKNRRSEEILSYFEGEM